MGKHKPIYDPSTDCGDYIVATNCQYLHVTGKKRTDKLYYSHSTRPGSLKSISLERMMGKWGGGEVLRRAVRGMLPKNRLRDVRLARLKTFEGPAHPHKANILKYPGQKAFSIASIPEVQETLAASSTITASEVAAR